MPVRCNYINDVIFLGYSNVSTKYDIYASLMPFINGILNLFTLTITKPFYNFEIYPNHPKTMFQDILKMSIDILAVTGILANVYKYSKLYSINIGFVKGLLYALFTFLIPNLFMLNVLDISKTPIIRFIIGIIFIYLLDLSVNYLSCMYLDYTNREKVSN
jgi:hypothetical protein